MNNDINLLSGESQSLMRELFLDESVKAQLLIYLKERKKLIDILNEAAQTAGGDLLRVLGPFTEDISGKVSGILTEMGYGKHLDAVNEWFGNTYK